jgi:cardiolipin synthase
VSLRFNQKSLAGLVALGALLSAGCGLSPRATAFDAGLVGGPLRGLDAPETPSAAAQTSTAGARHLYVLPDDTTAFLLQALDGAKKVIRLECYMLSNARVLAALAGAKSRGVTVQVLLEPHPFPTPHFNDSAAKKLAAAGVAVVWTSSAFKFTHAKFILVDDQTAYVSTANFTASGLEGNRDYVVGDQSPADVADLVQLFQADYAHAPFKPNNPDLVLSPMNSRAQIMTLIKGATKDIQVAVEIAADPELDALIATKVKQGVHVEALFSAPAKASFIFGLSPNAATAQAWVKAGAQVRYQKAPYLHAKEIIVDNARMYVGSVNLSTSSMDKDREVGLVVADPALIQPVARAAVADWLAAIPVGKSRLPAPVQAMARWLGENAPPEFEVEE